MSAVIEIEGLTKTYRRLRSKKTTTALDGLDLSVPEGGVFGFLGPNGSGKTTAIRCLLGLTHPTSGAATLLGSHVPSALPHVIGNVGAVVETPVLFPAFPARKNLTLLAKSYGIGNRRVDEVLETVGLTERADDTVKRFSLGMRQRLGIGAALLKDPELLILDEPANGLDPPGIRDIRALMRKLADEGRTVFVSSHILSEIEQSCDSVAVLTRGRCVASGTVKQVLATSSVAAGYKVKLHDLPAGKAVLSRAGFHVEMHEDHLVVQGKEKYAEFITRLLGRENLWLTELTPQAANLEDVFLQLVGEPRETTNGSTK